MLFSLSLLLLAQGFEIDLGGGSGASGAQKPGVELGKSDLDAARADFAQGRFGTALARASQITAGGLTGPVANEAAILQGLAALRLELPRLAVLLVADTLSSTAPAVRAELLQELGPLFESAVTAPELARVLHGVPPAELDPKWRPFFGYHAARAALAEEVAAQEAEQAPRERKPAAGKEVKEGDALALEESGLGGAFADQEQQEEAAGDQESKSAAAQAKIQAAEAEGKRKKKADNEGEIPRTAKTVAKVRSLLGLVPRGHEMYAKAQLQAGLVATLEADDESALGHFRMANKYGDSKVRAVALMQMARVHYAHGQMRAALDYYRKVPASSPDWPRALFEQAWAQFRRGHFGRVLGILEAFDSPFLSDQIIEEIEVLKALSFYENCRYDEAVAAATLVLNKRSIYDRLSGALAEMPKGSEWLSQFLRRGQLEDDVLARRLDQLSMQPSIARSISIFEGAEGEYSRLLGAGLQPRDLSRLERVFKLRFRALREQVGLLVRGAMLGQRVSLANLLKSALALKVEIEEQRTKVLQQELRGGTGGVIAVPTGDPVSVTDDYNWWPFEGEYWRDELETYEVHLGSSCR